MIDPTAFIFAFFIGFFGIPILNKVRLSFLESRMKYVKALLDFAENIHKVADKGIEKVEQKAKAKPEDITIDYLGDSLLLMCLNEILRQINQECHKTKSLPFLYISNPEEKVRRKFSKSLPVLNTAYERFVLDKPHKVLSEDAIKKLK